MHLQNVLYILTIKNVEIIFLITYNLYVRTVIFSVISRARHFSCKNFNFIKFFGCYVPSSYYGKKKMLYLIHNLPPKAYELVYFQN